MVVLTLTRLYIWTQIQPWSKYLTTRVYCHYVRDVIQCNSETVHYIFCPAEGTEEFMFQPNLSVMYYTTCVHSLTDSPPILSRTLIDLIPTHALSSKISLFSPLVLSYITLWDQQNKTCCNTLINCLFSFDHHFLVSWKSVAAGTITVVLLAIISLSVFLWIRWAALFYWVTECSFTAV